MRAMYAKYEEGDEGIMTGRCFVSTRTYKSPMTTNVRSLLQSFSIPLNAYDYELIAFDDTVAYFDNLVISASNQAMKSSTLLLETQKQLDSMKMRI